ncbi:MAG TPA: histidine kinase, partial [Balneolaceae bacterium]|nr:histidine kinase [Balneolaceae bacterium]
MQNDTVEIEDLRQDERFKDKDFVVEDPQYRSYAGYPLKTPDGYNIGAI